MSNHVIYIGKSCRDFTHNKEYKFAGISDMWNSFVPSLLCVYGNRGNMLHFGTTYESYIHKNFKLLNEEQYKKYIRKIKLNKLKK